MTRSLVRFALPTVLLLAACSSNPSEPVGPTPSGDEVVDDFERSALGPNWTYVPTGSNAGIVGGKDFGMMSAGFMSLDWTGSRFGADQFSEVVIAARKDPNLMVQVHVRRQSSFARYGFHYNVERTPPAWEIKYDGVPTAQTRILGTSTTSGPAPGDVIRLEARGRVISGYKNGQAIITATDNDPSAVLLAGGTGITARTVLGSTTTTYPAPIAASWRGGSLR
jgi:hypothetical protein